MTTTLDPDGQRTALEALGGRHGSVVALEPQTGRVRVMVSVPEYDPNLVPERFSELSTDDAKPLFNRATRTSCSTHRTGSRERAGASSARSPRRPAGS